MNKRTKKLITGLKRARDNVKINQPYQCKTCGCNYFEYYAIGGLKCVDCGEWYNETSLPQRR